VSGPSGFSEKSEKAAPPKNPAKIPHYKTLARTRQSFASHWATIFSKP